MNHVWSQPGHSEFATTCKSGDVSEDEVFRSTHRCVVEHGCAFA